MADTKISNLVAAGPLSGSEVGPIVQAGATVKATAQAIADLGKTISAASKLLGRGSAGGAGATQEITLGTGLTMTGTTLSAGGASTANPLSQFAATTSAQLAGVMTDETGFSGGTGNLVFSNAPTIVNPVVGTQSVGDNSTLAASTAFVVAALGIQVNAQTGTTYTYLAGDRGKLVTHSNTAAIAGTLPQATGSFAAGWFVYVQNRNNGILTVTPTTSTIDGFATITLYPQQCVTIVSDGTNYFTQRNNAYQNIPQVSQSAAYTTVLSDAGKHIFHPSADTTARVWTIDSNANVAYPIGTALTFVNQNAAGVITISITSDTMRLAGTGTTGSRTLAANGIATALKVVTTEWIISGTGLT